MFINAYFFGKESGRGKKAPRENIIFKDFDNKLWGKWGRQPAITQLGRVLDCRNTAVDDCVGSHQEVVCSKAAFAMYGKAVGQITLAGFLPQKPRLKATDAPRWCSGQHSRLSISRPGFESRSGRFWLFFCLPEPFFYFPCKKML